MSDLALRAVAVDEAFMALGNECFEADGATFIRAPDWPDIWDANHAAHVTASTPEEIERLLARTEREFAGHRHRRFHLDFTAPPEFEARLALEGYERSDSLLLALEDELTGDPPEYEVRAVESEDDWSAYSILHDLDWREYKGRMPHVDGYDEGTARQTMLHRRAKCPPVRCWLAWLDGEPRAYLSSWGGTEGMGMLEDLFCQPEYRRRGLATALVHRCVAEARKDGAGPVMIPADPSDTPKNMYAALGFRPAATKRNYMKPMKD